MSVGALSTACFAPAICCRCESQNIRAKDQLTLAAVDLPDTINERCTGIIDTVIKTDAALTHLLTCFMQTKHSTDSKRVPQTFRRCLRQLVKQPLFQQHCFWRNATGLFRTQIHWMSYPQRPEPTNGNMYIREGHCKQLTASPQKQTCEPSLSLLHQMGKLKSGSFLLFNNPVNWKHSQILNAWMCMTYQTGPPRFRCQQRVRGAQLSHDTMTRLLV